MKKSWLKYLALLLAVALAGSLFLQPPAVLADKPSELKGQIEELEDKKKEIEDEIQKLQDSVSEQETELATRVAEKNALDQEIFLLIEQENTMNEQLTAYNMLIADKQDELDEAQAKLEELQDRYKDRIRAMEKNEGLSYWSVLFRASSFTEMLDEVRMIAKINQADRQCLSQMKDAALEVEQAARELLEQREGLEEARQELAANRETMRQKREQADEALQELMAMGQEYELLLLDAKQEMGDVLDDIAQAKKEYQQALREQELENQKPKPPKPPKPVNPPDPVKPQPPKPQPPQSSGTWLIPVNYVYISDPYGPREQHPIDGVPRMHYGVDLAAYQGNPIFATRSGVVTRATYGSSAGYHVYIDHGDGFTSIYMHMTNYIVSPGQHVDAGQVIGYVGSTGASTGPHLHFGLTKNGAYVNPADYVNLY